MRESGKIIYRRLLRYAWPYRGRILLSIVASVGVAASDAGVVKLVHPFIDQLVVAGDWGMAWLVPLVVVGLATFKGLSRYVQEYFIKTSGQLIMQDIRNQLYGHTVSLSMSFFSRNSSGILMSRILNDVGVMQAATAEVLVGILREGMTLVALTGVAFYTDWKLAALAFIVLPAVAVPASAIGKKIKSYSRRGQAAIGDLTAGLEQTISGIKVIKAFGMEEREKEKFCKVNRSYYNFLRKVFKYDAASSPVIEILSSFGVAAVLWYGLSRVKAGSMTQGELFSVLAAVLFMYTPAKRLTKFNNKVQKAIGAAERVFDILNEKPEIEERTCARDLGPVKGKVDFQKVCFAYEKTPVIQDLDITALPGEVVALVGPSGAGKSTIIGLLNRFYDASEGSIRVDDVDIREVTLLSLRQNLALVDQETFLFNGSVSDNIRFGCPGADDVEVEAAARQAFADEFIQSLPDGYETQIGDKGVRLSGGQRQRLCIARAILRDAPILMLDEATSALDTESESKVQEALNNLMKNRTTFVIAHRLSTILHADKIIVMDQGRVCETGKHQELLDNNGLYRKLYDMQFKG